MKKKPNKLIEKVTMSALTALGEHFWEAHPEVQQLASVLGFQRVKPDRESKKRRYEEREPKRPTKRSPKPKPRWDEEVEDDYDEAAVIDLVQRADGSYGEPHEA